MREGAPDRIDHGSRILSQLADGEAQQPHAGRLQGVGAGEVSFPGGRVQVPSSTVDLHGQASTAPESIDSEATRRGVDSRVPRRLGQARPAQQIPEQRFAGGARTRDDGLQPSRSNRLPWRAAQAVAVTSSATVTMRRWTASDTSARTSSRLRVAAATSTTVRAAGVVGRPASHSRSRRRAWCTTTKPAGRRLRPCGTVTCTPGSPTRRPWNIAALRWLRTASWPA